MAIPVEPKERGVGVLPREVRSEFRIGAHVRMAVLAGLLVVAFWPILKSMYGSWFDERLYMEHGILVAPAAAYMAWTKRDKLKAIPAQPSIWGAVLITWGALQALLGTVAQWIWVSR